MTTIRTYTKELAVNFEDDDRKIIGSMLVAFLGDEYAIVTSLRSSGGNVLKELNMNCVNKIKESHPNIKKIWFVMEIGLYGWFKNMSNSLACNIIDDTLVDGKDAYLVEINL